MSKRVYYNMICFAVHSQTGVNNEIEHRKKVIILFVTVVFAVAVAVAVATFIILL